MRLSPNQKPQGKRAKRRSFPFILLFSAFLFSYLAYQSLYPPLPKLEEPPRIYSNESSIDFHFCLIRALEKARSIYLVMFGLTDPALLKTLSQKVKEKIPTTIYYDPTASFSIKKKLPLQVLNPVQCSGLMHQKILVLNDEMVFIGSSNFTTASLRMHDNLVLGFVSQKVAHFLKENAPHHSAHLSTQLHGETLDLWLLPDLKGKALSEMKKLLRSSRKSIRAALFTFTHPALLEELISLHRKGIEVSVIIDLYSSIGASSKVVEALKKENIQVLTSRSNKLLHHKFALIDDHTLIMGSANWTKSAFTKNRDCLLFLRNLNTSQKKELERIWKRLYFQAQM